MSTTQGPARSALIALLALQSLANPTKACGFDGVFDGAFGVPHPRSIEVAVAVRRAVEEEMLPPSALEPIVPGAAGLWRAIDRLHALERRLSAIAAGVSLPVASMAVLFIDSGLWTRFTRVAGGYSSQFHAPPAGPEEIVVVSDEAAIAGILDGRLSARTAFDKGLIIVDAPPPQQKRVRDLLIAAFEARLPPDASPELVGRPMPWRNSGR
jgi:hypothetical protein